MNSLERYENLKQKAKDLLRKGQLNEYLRVLRELAGMEPGIPQTAIHWN